MISSLTSKVDFHQALLPNSLGEAIRELAQGKDACQPLEKRVQQKLNEGIKPTNEELALLHSYGYSISFDPQTLEKFRNFVFPNDPELTEAIQSANPEGGLLIDRYKMYRPGPASAKNFNGAAKGYNEIFALFEQQTTEKRRIAHDAHRFISCIEENLPKDHLWKGEKTILDIGCGNGVQIQELLTLYPCSVIGIDNQKGCIDQCQKLMPDHLFEQRDCFGDVPSHLKQKGNLLLVSQLYCSREKATLLIERLQGYQASQNTLIMFVNSCAGSDGDRIANKFSFLRGKPSSSMSDDFKKALEDKGYFCAEKVSQAKLLFPELSSHIRHQLLQIERGDYENPYANMDPDCKVFKALMEFIASFPLESMTHEEILIYLDELAETFKSNGGPYLIIRNRILFAHSNRADKEWTSAFQKAEQNKPAFEDVSNLMDLGLLNEAKQKLGGLLKKLEGKNCAKNLQGFQLMSEIHLKEAKYPEAAGILWYAKRLDPGGKVKIERQLERIEYTLLSKSTSQNEGPLKGTAQAQIDQEKLKQLRGKLQEEFFFSIQPIEDQYARAKALRHLYKETITKELKIYIHELTQDVIEQMREWGQKMPCEYAIIGLGSLAREEMTPYSDFEFAILIDSEKNEDKCYFRLLTQLLHLRFINLGETILPSLDISSLSWAFDKVTPRGLSFDGSMPSACKTPLGKKRNRKGDYELIHNPHFLSQLQFIDRHESEQERLWVLQRYHLPSILAVCTYVSGSENGLNLVVEYKRKVEAILESGEGKNRAFDLMRDDFDNFKPHLEEEESGRNYKVKKDLYRFPNTMFDGLANYFCLKGLSTWERIEELEERGIFTSSASQDLKELVMLSQELRFSTYLKYGRQKEDLDIDKKNMSLQELYYRVLPFAKAIEMFCSQMDKDFPEACLKKERFYNNSPFYQAKIALRHMNYLEADRCLALEALDTVEYYEILASVKNTLAKYKEAENAYLQAIEKQPSCELYLSMGNVRQSLAQYKKKEFGEKSAEEAFFKAKELAEKSSNQLLKEKVYRDLAFFYEECGDNTSMRSCLNLSKKMSEKRVFNKQKDPEYRVVLDLGLGQIKKLEARILHDVDSKFKQSEKVLSTAFKIYTGYYRREDHPAIGSLYSAAGRVSLDLGKIEEALRCHRRSLEIDLSIFGDNHPSIANNYNNMAIAYGNQGEYKKAIKLHKKALGILLHAFDENHPDTANNYDNMALCYNDLGKKSRAFKFTQKALNIRLLIFGEKHPNIAVSYNNIAIICNDQGEYEKAIQFHKKALMVNLQAFGENHPEVANCYANMSFEYSDLGKYTKAFNSNQKALTIRSKIFGKNHSDIAMNHNNAGIICHTLGEYYKAMKSYQIALKINLEVYGKNHPEISSNYNNLGDVYFELGDYNKAFEFYKKDLKIDLRIFGKNHCYVANCYTGFANVYRAKGKYNKALESYRCALKIYSKTLDKEHIDFASIYNDMGELYECLALYNKALAYHEKSLQIIITTFGKNHPDTADCYCKLSAVYAKLEKSTQAFELNQNALKIVLKFFGDNHPDVAKCYCVFGLLYYKNGEHNTALEYYQKAIKIKTQFLGENHPSVASCYNSIGDIYAHLELNLKALEQHQKAEQIQLRTLGKGHPDVAASYKSMSKIYFKMGDHKRVVEYCRRALEILCKTFKKRPKDPHPDILEGLEILISAVGKIIPSERLDLQEIYPLCIDILGAEHKLTKEVRSLVRQESSL